MIGKYSKPILMMGFRCDVVGRYIALLLNVVRSGRGGRKGRNDGSLPLRCMCDCEQDSECSENSNDRVITSITYGGLVVSAFEDLRFLILQIQRYGMGVEKKVRATAIIILRLGLWIRRTCDVASRILEMYCCRHDTRSILRV